MGKSCGIYEIKGKDGRRSYKIFASPFDLKNYLIKNKDMDCKSGQPLYRRETFETFPGTQIRTLTKEEAEQYLKEQQEAGDKVK